MHRKHILVIVMLVSLILFAQAANAACGLSLPCYQSATDDSGAIFAIENLGANAGIHGFGTTGVKGEGSEYGVDGWGTLTGVIGQTSSGIGVYGKSVSGVGVQAEAPNHDGVSASSGHIGHSAVYAHNTGGGWGVFGSNTSSTPAIQGSNAGSGDGIFGSGGTNGVHGQSPSATFAGVYGENIGKGPGVTGISTTGNAGFFKITNASSTAAACRVENSGKGIGAVVRVLNSASSAAALSAKTVGTGKAGQFQVANPANNSYAMYATTNGTGWAGVFVGTAANSSHGVYIKTNGGTGLMVSGGTKSAVVPTSKGERALYAEEASEVYFTDYGFGKLQSGKVVIPVDPLFAETVNLREDYHVFVQAYGEADIYVTNCTPTSFEVRLRAKDAQGDGNVKFSYRLVGKRKGFETARLELAPPAGKDEDLAAEKGGEKVALVRE
jgi:hypothetical protein